MERVIVTGATSFIGVHLINLMLQNSNVDIVAVVRPDSPKIGLVPLSGRITILPLDMGGYRKLDRMIEKPCDTFIHLAWNGTRGADRMNSEMQSENFDHSVAAVEAVSRLGCKLVVSAGSQAEYGNHDEPISENSACFPNTEYGKFKLLFYRTIQETCARKGMHLKEPRFFSLYGAGDYENTMIISTLRKMLRHDPCDFTPGTQMWDFLHIEDAVRGIIHLIENDFDDGVYNFGSGESRLLREYIEEMYELTRSKSVLNFGAIPYPETGVVSLQPIVDKLLNTGWCPEMTFRDGVLQVIKTIRDG